MNLLNRVVASIKLSSVKRDFKIYEINLLIYLKRKKDPYIEIRSRSKLRKKK